MEDDRRNIGINKSEFGFAGEQNKKEESFGFDSQLVRLNEDTIPPRREIPQSSELEFDPDDPDTWNGPPQITHHQEYEANGAEEIDPFDSPFQPSSQPFGPNIIDLTSAPMGGDDLSYIPDDMGESTWNMADTLERFGPQLDGYITSIFNFITNIIEDVAGLPKREKLLVDDVARSNLSRNLIEYVNYVDPRITASPFILVAGSFGALMFTYIMKPVSAPAKKRVKKSKRESASKELSYEDEEKLTGALDGDW